MKVEDLINQLSQYDKDLDIYIDLDYKYETVSSVERITDDLNNPYLVLKIKED